MPERDGRCSVQRKGWASRFAAGLFAAIAAARRFPLLSLSPPRAAPAPRCAWPPPSAVAALRAGARPLGLRQRAVRSGPGTVSSLASLPAGRTTSRPSAPARSRSALPSSAAKRLAPLGGCVKRLPTLMVHCATRALCANPAGGGVLRCAAARGGSARHRAGATVAQAQPPLRPAQARPQAPIGPCARTIAPTRRQAPPTPRGSVARACPKEPSHRGWAPSVQPIRRST